MSKDWRGTGEKGKVPNLASFGLATTKIGSFQTRPRNTLDTHRLIPKEELRLSSDLLVLATSVQIHSSWAVLLRIACFRARCIE
jgi:hypothetical protein